MTRKYRKNTHCRNGSNSDTNPALLPQCESALRQVSDARINLSNNVNLNPVTLEMRMNLIKNMKWVVITGGGSGIGRTLVQHFSKDYKVLTCGRRRANLEKTKAISTYPENVTIAEADISESDDRKRFVSGLPIDAQVHLLIQNAAIGDPAELNEIDADHLEHALQVNVVAPLALVQLLSRNLQANEASKDGRKGRVLHLGTSVAHRPQRGTLTYGVTKKAFHRLYEQLNMEGIVCGSLSPGLVDTEGVRDHVSKARSCNLPHVGYFDRAFENKWTTPPNKLIEFIMELMEMDDETFISKEWSFSEWRKRVDCKDSKAITIP